MKNSHQIGLEMEELAARYLEYKGYRVLERRYKGRLGEIDLIAECKDLLVFAEVKYRKDLTSGRPALNVSAAKQQKIRRTAMMYWQRYCSEFGGENVFCRFVRIETGKRGSNR